VTLELLIILMLLTIDFYDLSMCFRFIIIYLTVVILNVIRVYSIYAVFSCMYVKSTELSGNFWTLNKHY
jgi:hypothetical protein